MERPNDDPSPPPPSPPPPSGPGPAPAPAAPPAAAAAPPPVRRRRIWPMVLVGVLVLVVAAVVVIVLSIDRVAARAVERSATDALGVETSVGSMSVGLMGGTVGLSELEVDNPEGFESPHFLTMREGDTTISLRSLMQDTVVIPRLTLSGLDVNLERRQGRGNYDVILENLKRSQGEPTPQERADARQFIINDLLIQDVTVHADMGVAGELTRIDVQIPEIRLQDVGSETEGGVLLKELAGIVTQAVLEAVVEKAGTQLPAEMRAALREQLAQVEALQRAGLEVAEQVRGQVEEAVGEAERVLEGIGGNIEGTTREIEERTREIEERTRGFEERLRGLGGRREEGGEER